MIMHDATRAIIWEQNRLKLLDQRILPTQIAYIEYNNAPDVANAITDMVVRGAPAIGITAAYGVVLSAQRHQALAREAQIAAVKADMAILAKSRPTAINLMWALDRMTGFMAQTDNSQPLAPQLLAEAAAIHQEDIDANLKMGELGSALIEKEGSAVLTHCNAGALATGGHGTALGVIRTGYATGKIKQVFADETRPWMQGARLTAWEMVQEKIPVTLLVEGAAATLMKQGKVDWVIVGSDRIAANGDVANKIGTYSAAVAARHHGVKFMVVAPTSTVDMSVATGDDIPIENRAAEEIMIMQGKQVAAEGANAWNPVFDVTPADLVDAIVTEKGVVLNPTAEKMRQMMES
jgi:methylthioribose-1-phosphate isomerase